MRFFLKSSFVYLIKLFVLLFAFVFIWRLVFLTGFIGQETDLNIFEILRAMFIGFKFDIRLSVILLVPYIITFFIPIRDRYRVILNKILYGFVILIMTVIYLVDLSYYSYLHSRLNATILTFFGNADTSFRMVWETYPVIIYSLVAIFSTFVAVKLISWVFATKVESLYLSIQQKVTGVVVTILLMAFGVYGSITAYPLRWSEAFFSSGQFVSALGLNPVLYLADTYAFRNVDYDLNKVREHYNQVAEFLGVKDPDINKLNFVRSFDGDSAKRANPHNFVIIVMESTSFNKTNMGGNELNATPSLDELSKESILFNHFFTPTVATARSIFALVSSLPDVSKVKTTSRNPLSVAQNSAMSALVDHEKYYFLGGSASWGNIRGILSHNIPDLKIYEEGSYSAPRVDVWGISDLDLMKEAMNIFRSRDQTRPFVSIIQTSGFHRPYTIPKDRENFKILNDGEFSNDQIKNNGFDSLEQLNALRLQDYAVGAFIKMLKNEKFYENTVVFIIGDHGIVGHNPHIPEWEKARAYGYHVPLIIHSPKLFPAPRIEPKFASELDLMPTIAGLAGVPYKTRAFGKDLFNPELDGKRIIFNYNWYAPYDLTMMDELYYFEKLPGHKDVRLYLHNKDQVMENITDKDIPLREIYNSLTEGLYETAKYLINNNPQIK